MGNMLGFVLLLKMLMSMISIFFPLFGLVNTFKVAGHFNSGLFNPKLQPWTFQRQLQKKLLNPRLLNHESFNPKYFNPKFFNHELFNHEPFNH